MFPFDYPRVVRSCIWCVISVCNYHKKHVCAMQGVFAVERCESYNGMVRGGGGGVFVIIVIVHALAVDRRSRVPTISGWGDNFARQAASTKDGTSWWSSPFIATTKYVCNDFIGCPVVNFSRHHCTPSIAKGFDLYLQAHKTASQLQGPTWHVCDTSWEYNPLIIYARR